MTAEIAVLNKAAVALATDSVITLLGGTEQEKVYDAADKLFQLSYRDPIGIMIYDDMNFMEIPLQVLIKRYSESCRPASRLEDAAMEFLNYLHGEGVASDSAIKKRRLIGSIGPRVQKLAEAIKNAILKVPKTSAETLSKVARRVVDEQIEALRTLVSSYPDATLIGGNIKVTSIERRAIVEVVEERLRDLATRQQRRVIIRLFLENLGKLELGHSRTGIVIAGYGSEEKFPTLISVEIHGMVADCLKYETTKKVDIDRNGDRADVIPFAQREMVERFLYGLDEQVEDTLLSFGESLVNGIIEDFSASLALTPGQRAKLDLRSGSMQAAVVDKLIEIFEARKGRPRKEILSIVEFMPKPELARMAEALVNLTSIKHRVSRGIATVGGPIDVAVISQADGFVWVKRKNYFPAELNPRFMERMRSQNADTRRHGNGNG